jgi:hypothetical protein
MRSAAQQDTKRVDSKVRFSPEMYEDLRDVSHRTRQSFQGIIDESLRVWMELERGKRPEFAAGMAAAAMVFRDAVSEAVRRQLPQKKMYELKANLDRFISRVGDAELPELAELGRVEPEPIEDPAARYILEVLSGVRDEPHEKALAAYLRTLADEASEPRLPL